MFDQSKKRILALDGGGILGLISLRYLRVIELQLRDVAFLAINFGDKVDRENENMIPPNAVTTSHAFTYGRYDVRTSPEAIAELGLSDIDGSTLTLDNIDAADHLVRLRDAAAARSVNLAKQFSSFLT